MALIDLGMPGLPGDQLMQEIRHLDPAVAGVLITGWEVDEDDVRAARFDLRLQKPFEDLGFLGRTIVEAIALHDRRSSPG